MGQFDRSQLPLGAERKDVPMSMFRSSPGRGGQSFIEYALLLILVSIVLLSILLILGNDLRTLISDILQRWFPTTEEASQGLQILTLRFALPLGRGHMT